MEEVYEFLKSCGMYYIATVDGDQPRVRPFGTVNVFEGRLYIQTGKVKPVAHQLAANPKLELCAMKDGTVIRLSGTAVEDDRVEAQASMLDAYPNLKAQYQAGDGNTVVYWLKDATAVMSAFGSSEKVITF